MICWKRLHSTSPKDIWPLPGNCLDQIALYPGDLISGSYISVQMKSLRGVISEPRAEVVRSFRGEANPGWGVWGKNSPKAGSPSTATPPQPFPRHVINSVCMQQTCNFLDGVCSSRRENRH